MIDLGSTAVLHDAYEAVVQFASQGRFGAEITAARGEYVERTGDLFESDRSYERRLAAFLEWYVLDRPVKFSTGEGFPVTPLNLYLSEEAEDPQLRSTLEPLGQGRLSLFEFKKTKGDILKVVDLLSNEKLNISGNGKVAGLEGGDILETRMFSMPMESDTAQYIFSDAIAVHPRGGRSAILKTTKLFRKKGEAAGLSEPIRLVHRIAYLANRCERYGHVDPKEIFSEILKD